MRPFSPHPAPPSRYLMSSVRALERECMYMGWPASSAEGKVEVERFLRDLGFAVQSPNSPVDLYTALNRIRLSSWEGESEVWRRYVTSRRDEVEALNGPRRIRARLQRTVFAQVDGPISWVRVPVPFEHSAQTSLAWSVCSVSAQVERERSGEGFLDLLFSEELPRASVEISYTGIAHPQGPATEPLDSADSYQGSSSPFIVPDRVAQRLSQLSALEAEKAKVYELWKIFHGNLVSGHVYHREHLVSGGGEGFSSGWFDCVTSSWNFCALLERVGIPARVIGGLLLHRFGPSPHYWCEVALNGAWFPLDFYSWDLSEGEERIRERFFGNLEPRLRFECFPRVFSRFLPNVQWFIERSSEEGKATFTYRRLDSGGILAEDTWSVEFCEP